MNVMITGSTGYIAGRLLDSLSGESFVSRVFSVGRKETGARYLELASPDKFDYEILRETDIVIFTAAVSGPDMCAEEYVYCRNINVSGTVYFIEKALEKGCRVLFFSSDAVYGSRLSGTFTEVSGTNADTPYGIMKKAVEDHFCTEQGFKSVRLSYVVSAADKFVSYCLDCMNKGRTAEIYHPFYRNCITLGETVQTVVWLLQNWDEFSPRVLNVAGNELVSRLRIADEINRMFGNRLEYRVVHPSDDFFRNRPATVQMESIYLQKYGVLGMKNFSERFNEEMGEIKT